jgi:hypothetical protein
MGVSITITDNEFPISPVFVDYVATVVSGGEFATSEWHDQLSENLSNQQAEVLKKAQENAAKVMESELGKRFVGRAYELFLALLSGDVDKIRDIQFRFHFINVIGVPRNGGSYLTKELYRALGFEPDKVPNVIAHDVPVPEEGQQLGDQPADHGRVPDHGRALLRQAEAALGQDSGAEETDQR